MSKLTIRRESKVKGPLISSKDLFASLLDTIEEGPQRENEPSQTEPEGESLNLKDITRAYSKTEEHFRTSGQGFQDMAFASARARHEGAVGSEGYLNVNREGQLIGKQGDGKHSDAELDTIRSTTVEKLFLRQYRPLMNNNRMRTLLSEPIVFNKDFLEHVPGLCFTTPSREAALYIIGSMIPPKGMLPGEEALKSTIELAAVLGITASSIEGVNAFIKEAMDVHHDRISGEYDWQSNLLEDLIDNTLDKDARLDFANPVHRMPLLPSVETIFRDGTFDKNERYGLLKFMVHRYLHIPSTASENAFNDLVGNLSIQTGLFHAVYEYMFTEYSTGQLFDSATYEGLKKEITEARNCPILSRIEQEAKAKITHPSHLQVYNIPGSDTAMHRFTKMALTLLEEATEYSSGYFKAFIGNNPENISEPENVDNYIIHEGEPMFKQSMRLWNGLFGSNTIEEGIKEIFRHPYYRGLNFLDQERLERKR